MLQLCSVENLEKWIVVWDDKGRLKVTSHALFGKNMGNNNLKNIAK
jgi:hypothetical protein